MQNGNLVLVFVAVVFVLGGLLYIYNPDPVEYKNPSEKEQVFCTDDAKLCPDGSYVGRTGPDCQFRCPAEIMCKGGGPCPIPSNAIFEDGTVSASSSTAQQ